ncbi:SHOCT domain-containing protein [Halomontanus rarus]|uniref:SHOCT domain-containing protein n=1 Tax=Halomontanus rarus TaxID=3034020 RepID=UPI00307C1AE7
MPTKKHSRAATSPTTLETVRERYAAGELTDAEFERRVEGLLETDSVSDAEGVSRASEAEFIDAEREVEPAYRERETERR